MNHQVASTSRSKSKSGSTTKKRELEMDKTEVEDGTLEKKLKMEANPETENANVNFNSGQIKIQIESVDKLPPEMVLKILQDLDTQTILACRLVNLKWTGIASEICRSRSDIEIHFRWEWSNEKIIITHTKLGMSLEDFTKCHNKSKFFPCNRFRFDCLDLSTLCNENWTEFISDYGENITCLKLKIANILERETKLVVELLSSLANLQEFGIEMNSYTPENRYHKEPHSDPVQLPNIKVFYLNENDFSLNPGTIYPLLQATVNLQRIELFSPECRPIQDFSYVQFCGKLNCLHAATLHIDGDFAYDIEQSPSILKEWKLKELNIVWRTDANKYTTVFPKLAEYLSIFFESNKDVLEKIRMVPLGLLPGIKFPKFSKVTSLCLRENDSESFFLPPDSGIKLEDIFPALRSLDLESSWSDVFPCVNSESKPCFQNLDTLKVDGYDMCEISIVQISLSCPNLKHLKFNVYGGEEAEEESQQSIWDFPEVGTAIWTHLKRLQSLEVVINLNSPDNAFPAIDSCITGFSKEDCTRLYDLIKKKEEKLSKTLESQGKTLTSKLDSDLDSDFEPERKNPSILDLKDLKNFKVWLCCPDYCQEKTNLALTSVSQEFALKRMENLKFEIKKIIEAYS